MRGCLSLLVSCEPDYLELYETSGEGSGAGGKLEIKTGNCLKTAFMSCYRGATVSTIMKCCRSISIKNVNLKLSCNQQHQTGFSIWRLMCTSDQLLFMWWNEKKTHIFSEKNERMKGEIANIFFTNEFIYSVVRATNGVDSPKQSETLKNSWSGS